MKNRKIRILLLGDPQVGKTSWITSLVSDSQPDKIPPVIDPVVFTEMFVHQFSVSTVLIDTPSDILDSPDLFRDEVKSAQVILLLYNLADGRSIDSLKAKWMPRITEQNANVPVIIIGNKRDLLDEMMSEDTIPDENRIEKVLVPLIKAFKQVNMGFECSAVLSQYISDIIYGSHIAVLFPLSPLYDISTKAITEQFKKALTRIFRICDRDNDNKWSDSELREFQLQVFQGELTISDIQGIKQLIREDNTFQKLERSSSSDKYGQDITVEGFLTLQKKCIELMKMQVSWAILRYFNYEDNLEIDRKLFKDRLLVDDEAGQTVELSGKANQFLLNSCFRRFGVDQRIPAVPGLSSSHSVVPEIIETVLLKNKLTEIFFPLPETNPENQLHPFIDMLSAVSQQDKDYLLEEEWLCLWALKTQQNYLEVYRILNYIGYEGTLEQTFLVTNRTNSLNEIQRMNTRHLYNICLVGIEDCQSYLPKILDAYRRGIDSINPEQQGSASISNYVDYATYVKLENGRKKIIVFTFVPDFNFYEVLLQNAQEGGPKKKFDQIGVVYKTTDKLGEFLAANKEIERFNECPKFFVQINKDAEIPSLNQEEPIYRQYSKVQASFNGISTLKISQLNNCINKLIQKPTKGLDQAQIELIKQQDNFFSQNFHYLVFGSIISIGIAYWASRSSLSSLTDKIKTFFK